MSGVTQVRWLRPADGQVFHAFVGPAPGRSECAEPFNDRWEPPDVGTVWMPLCPRCLTARLSAPLPLLPDVALGPPVATVAADMPRQPTPGPGT
jgi:hypothetical protein